MINIFYIVEAQNGYFGWLLAQSIDNPNPKPTIHGLDDPDVDIRVPFHSSILHLYVDPPQPSDTNEISYYPVTARKHCYR